VKLTYPSAFPRLIALAYSATISLDPTKATAFQVPASFTTSAAPTINAASGGLAGQIYAVDLTTDASGTVVFTFGTNFKTVGTLSMVLSKTATIHFLSDGVNLIELGRTAAM